jgi:ABC-type multidrug transport system ATPase subunit
MTISLSDAGKRYNRDWIFRHLTYTFEAGQHYAVTGSNGSGKSTLLQVIGGAIELSEGILESVVRSREPGVGSRESGAGISQTKKSIRVSHEDLFRYISICAPYLELIEEMTATEFLSFHAQFKPFLADLTPVQILEIVGLGNAAGKQIRYYSSGMRQRVKLAQCIFSDVPVVLLDEPCTNLDAAGIALYHSLISNYCQNRTVIVSSNDEVEFSFCKERLSIMEYKKQ